MSRAQLTSTVEQNSAGAASPFVAGKNKIINGDFGIWQRGTSFTNPAGGFTADRWAHNADGSGKTIVISQQAFTPGTAPVAGYEGTYFYRLNQTVAGTGGTFNVFQTGLEDVRLFAGQTVTLSLWAKADASRLLGFTFVQDFGSGGSSTVGTFLTGPTVTTAWSRYSVTLTIPSVAGKTIGTSSALRIQISVPVNTTQTVDVWGVQLEAGSVATPFTTASGTLQGELALCQRYYEKSYDQGTSPGTATVVGSCFSGSALPASVVSTTGYILGGCRWKVEKRIAPTVTVYDYNGTAGFVTACNPGTGDTAGNNPYISGIGTAGAQIGRDGASGTRTAVNAIYYQYTASAEL